MCVLKSFYPCRLKKNKTKHTTQIKTLIAGPFPVLCLMIGSVVTRLVPDEGPPVNITGFEGLTRDEQRVLVASSVTFLAGIMQVKHIYHTQQQLCLSVSEHDKGDLCQSFQCYYQLYKDNPDLDPCDCNMMTRWIKNSQDHVQGGTPHFKNIIQEVKHLQSSCF